MCADQKENDDAYSEAETDSRREALLKKVLATPPKPHEPSKAKRGESQPK